MIVFLVALCIAAPMLILLVNPFEEFLPLVSVGTGAGGLREFNVLPRLVATAAFTGGALLWGAVAVARGRWRAGRWPRSLWVAGALFVAVNVLALVFAADWRFSLIGEHQRYQGLATTLLYVLLFAVAAVAVRTTRDVRLVLWALFAGALGTTVYAIIQRADLDWIPWTGPSVDRPFGTMGQANVQGAFLVAAVSAPVFLMLTAKERGQQIALAAGLVAILAALFFTLSRSAYLALGLVAIIWGLVLVRWLYQRAQEPGQRAGLVAIGGALVIVPFVLALAAILFTGLPGGRVAVFSSANDRALDARLAFWQLGLEMVADRPFLGYGQDAFSIKFTEYRDNPDQQGIQADDLSPESSHNFFIDLGAGTGLLGLLAFLGLVGVVFWHAYLRGRSTHEEELRLALIALGGGVLGYLAAVFFGFMETTSGWVFWLLLGAMAGLVAQVAPEEDHEAGGNPGPEESTNRRERRREQRARERRERQLEREQELSFLQANPLFLNVGTAVLSLLGALALVWAATLLAGDLYAGRAQDAANHGEHETAARFASRAVTLNPMHRDYLAQEARAQENIALRVEGGAEEEAALHLAIENYEKLVDRFQPTARELLSLALVKLKLAEVTGTRGPQVPCEATGTTLREEYCHVETALQVDFFNVNLHLEAARVYTFAGNEERAYELEAEAYCWGLPDCE